MKISVHRGLTELKLLDARINKGIQELNVFGVYKLSEDKVINTTDNKKEYTNKAKANFNSVVDLIDRRDKIKRLIVLSNAQTIVKIADKEYTVAEAIEKKNSILYKKSLLKTLTNQKRYGTNLLTSKMETMEKNLDDQIKIIVGNNKDNDTKYIEAFTEGYKNRNGYNTIDPLDIDVQIKNYEKEIGDFEAEVDAVLSEINATTFIEI